MTSVLDPCCGGGALLSACKRVKPNATMVGYDLDQEMVQVCQRGGHTCSYQQDIFAENTELPRHVGLICNPPYLGVNKLSSTIGVDRLKVLKAKYPADRAGACDLAGYVFRHVMQELRPVVSTWIVTNTIAQGGTRRVGLKWAVDNGYVIVSGLKDIRWPGDALVTVHVITIVDGEQVETKGMEIEYVPGYQLTT